MSERSVQPTGFPLPEIKRRCADLRILVGLGPGLPGLCRISMGSWQLLLEALINGSVFGKNQGRMRRARAGNVTMEISTVWNTQRDGLHSSA